MNPKIQQRRTVLNGLRNRATMATAEFYQKAGINASTMSLRFTVVPHGNNLFGVVDRQTGTVRSKVVGHMNACKSAQDFESTARFNQAANLIVANVGRWMPRWAFVFVVMLSVFTFMGVSR
jgi:hypothetical protein